MSRRIPSKKIAEALQEARGVISDAAESLGCSRQTIYNRISREKSLREAHGDAMEGLKDIAEQALYHQIEAGNITAIIFFLKTRGRDRGYGNEPSTKLDVHIQSEGSRQISGITEERIIYLVNRARESAIREQQAHQPGKS